MNCSICGSRRGDRHDENAPSKVFCVRLQSGSYPAQKQAGTN
ncbi:hypothetical protein [uncultured Nostoc sp.]